MSGDVQPRKRKDKRRKKDDTPGQEEPSIQATAPTGNEDFNIHVHNDHGTGGGICAKLVFFVLLSVLAVLIGMIFIEKRGLTDLDTAPTESRFANIFDGWIETEHEDDHHDHIIKAIEDHDEHDDHEAEEASVEEGHDDDHDEDHDDEQEDHDEEHEDDHEETEEQVSEEEHEQVSEEAEEEEQQVSEEAEEEAEDETQEESQEVNAEDQQDNEEDDEQEVSEEKQEEEEEEDEEIPALVDDAEDDVEESEPQVSEEEAENANDDNDADDNDAEDTNEDDDNTAEGEDDDNANNLEEEDNIDDVTDFDDVSQENEILEEDSAENPADVESDDQEEEEVVDNTAGEEEVLKEEAEKQEEAEQEESSSKIKVLPDADESEGSEDEHWTKQDSVPADLKQRLDLAEKNLRENSDLAYKLFTNLMEQLPNNNRFKYGRAQSLDLLAEQKRSNQLLQDSISSYYDLLQSHTISDKLYLKVAERCIDRIRFRGHYNKAVQVHNEIINRFPNNPSHRNQLAVTLLTSNRLSEAKQVLQEVLSKWPNDGFALAHYGFILKTKDNNMKLAVEYLRKGIESRVPGVIDGRFYFHLGDALQRLGRNDEAMNVYEDGVKHNVFLSKYQRSLYNIDRLTGKPWWPLNQTPYASFFKHLEDKWKIIREEGLALLNKAGYFKDEAENLRDTGQWKQFELFARGQKFVENCKKCPQTCSLIETFPDAKGCKRGQVKFSVMHPGTHVWPHCGPSNCRLRAHLGLEIPSKTFIRVAEETRSWTEGKIFLFDDSFEHEVWHNGSGIRLVLIVDVWHPELTAHEKRSLPAI